MNTVGSREKILPASLAKTPTFEGLKIFPTEERVLGIAKLTVPTFSIHRLIIQSFYSMRLTSINIPIHIHFITMKYEETIQSDRNEF